MWAILYVRENSKEVVVKHQPVLSLRHGLQIGVINSIKRKLPNNPTQGSVHVSGMGCTIKEHIQDWRHGTFS